MKYIKLFEEFINENIGPLHPVIKLLDKHYKLATTGTESARWAYQKDHCPDDEKESFTFLERRDLADAEDGLTKAKKIADRIDKMSKDFDAPVKDFIQYYINDWVDMSRKWGLASKTVFGAEQSCQQFNMGCENVKKLKDEFKKVSAEYEKVKEELEAKRVAAGAVWTKIQM